MSRRPPALVVPLVAALLLSALLVSGCGAAGQANPTEIGPQGVDELVIPTPSPDPDDFVDEVDNPWLPLAPGTVWTYDVAGSAVQRLEVRVEEAHETVAGVSCVVVRRTGTDRDGAVVEEVVTYLAQDDEGNVWLFGEDGDRAWRAGEDGAEAGLAMPAVPRVGDGYLHQHAPNAADRDVRVAAPHRGHLGPGRAGRGRRPPRVRRGHRPGGGDHHRRRYRARRPRLRHHSLTGLSCAPGCLELRSAMR